MKIRDASQITRCILLFSISLPGVGGSSVRGRTSAILPVSLYPKPVGPAEKSARYELEKNVMVRMRDGVMLATDVYRPARNGAVTTGKFPVIVYRTPYNKNGEWKDGIFFATHGYVVIAQDCRGRFASEGKFYPLINEGKDGYDTIEWAQSQPWSNGKVGTAGASYLAWTQYTAAMLDPPHLVAMFPAVGGSNFFPYPGGVPSLSESLWDLYMAETSNEAIKLPRVHARLKEIFKNPDAWYRLPPEQRGEVFKPLPGYWKIFQNMVDHPTFDNYWKQQGFYPAGNYRRFKDVPMFFISGWYDGSVSGVIENFVQFSRIQKSPKKLMIGPWPHATGKANCGQAYFGPSAAVNEQALELDWFDHWLKGRPFRIIGPSPIRIFRMGGGTSGTLPGAKSEPGGEWLPLKAWPPPGIRATRYYLQPNGLLRKSLPKSEGSYSYEDDPANPVPTRGGRFHSDCVQNQATLEMRADVLTFTTAPLKASISITGDIEVQFWISSTAPDTDFVAKLSDIYPDGYSMILAEGQTRCSYRNGLDRLKLMTPRTLYKLAIDLGPTSNSFTAGHRIRLDISSTDFPRLQPNSNTGAPSGKWVTLVKARNTVYYGKQHPSCLLLPTETGVFRSR